MQSFAIFSTAFALVLDNQKPIRNVSKIENSEWVICKRLFKTYYFFTATVFNFALISIEMAERSIFNFPDMVSITIVVSDNSEIFP